MRKLKDITASKAWIKVDDEDFASCRINDLLSIDDGEAEVIVIVTKITDNDIESQMDENAILEE